MPKRRTRITIETDEIVLIRGDGPVRQGSAESKAPSTSIHWDRGIVENLGREVLQPKTLEDTKTQNKKDEKL